MSKVAVRSKAKLQAAANDHMTLLSHSPERVRTYFEDPRSLPVFPCEATTLGEPTALWNGHETFCAGSGRKLRFMPAVRRLSTLHNLRYRKPLPQ